MSNPTEPFARIATIGLPDGVAHLEWRCTFEFLDPEHKTALVAHLGLNAWRQGTGAPDNAVGVDGDWYLRTSNGAIYRRASGTYTALFTPSAGGGGSVDGTAINPTTIGATTPASTIEGVTLLITGNRNSSGAGYSGILVGHRDSGSVSTTLYGSDNKFRINLNGADRLLIGSDGVVAIPGTLAVTHTGALATFRASTDENSYLNFLDDNAVQVLALGWDADANRGFLSNASTGIMNWGRGANPDVSFPSTGNYTFGGALVGATFAGNLLVNDGFSVTFGNGSLLRRGDCDDERGGAGGISLYCGLGHQLNWQAGWLYFSTDGGQVVEVRTYVSGRTPVATDDSTHRFMVGSRWIMANGAVYTCTDATPGSAVWKLGGENFGVLVAFLTPDGDNSTAALGDPAHPYQDAQTPYDAGARVLVLAPKSGTYGSLTIQGGERVQLVGSDYSRCILDSATFAGDAALCGNGIHQVQVDEVYGYGTDGTGGSGRSIYLDNLTVGGDVLAYGGQGAASTGPGSRGGNGGAGGTITATHCWIEGYTVVCGGNGGAGNSGTAGTAAVAYFRADSLNGVPIGSANFLLDGNMVLVTSDSSGNVFSWADMSGWIRTGSSSYEETYTCQTANSGHTGTSPDPANTCNFTDGTDPIGPIAGGDGGWGGAIVLYGVRCVGPIIGARGLGTDGAADGSAMTMDIRWSEIPVPDEWRGGQAVATIVGSTFQAWYD